MTRVCVEYKELIGQYLNNELSSLEFQNKYIDKFKNEDRVMDGFLFAVLDDLFGAVDIYTEDESLLVENSGFYLDEQGLREKAKNIFERVLVRKCLIQLLLVGRILRYLSLEAAKNSFGKIPDKYFSKDFQGYKYYAE